MITEHKFWFNTGVRPESVEGKLYGEHEAWRGGTKQIAFYLAYDPPVGARLMHLCDEPEENDYTVAIPVVGGGMLSKFAVFLKKWEKI